MNGHRIVRRFMNQRQADWSKAFGLKPWFHCTRCGLWSTATPADSCPRTREDAS